MSIPIGLIALALVILIGAYIVQPFFAKRGDSAAQARGGQPSVLRRRADLLEERNRIYTRIKEIEFEYETNKLSKEMYEQQRHALVAQAVDVLQQLDGLPTPADDPIEDALLAHKRQKEKTD